MAKRKRKGLSKKIRFEVFKRDRFRCQYCGGEAPDVVLQIDHIHPVVDGGTDEIENLLTACVGCNSGKGKRLLSDDTAVKKSRDQLEESQNRREQIEMMLEWKLEIVNMRDQEALVLAERWERALGKDRCLNAIGLRELRRLLTRFDFVEIAEAMDISMSQYFRYRDDGPTEESSSEGFWKIGGICHNRRARRREGLDG